MEDNYNLEKRVMQMNAKNSFENLWNLAPVTWALIWAFEECNPFVFTWHEK